MEHRLTPTTHTHAKLMMSLQENRHRPNDGGNSQLRDQATENAANRNRANILRPTRFEEGGQRGTRKPRAAKLQRRGGGGRKSMCGKRRKRESGKDIFEKEEDTIRGGMPRSQRSANSGRLATTITVTRDAAENTHREQQPPNPGSDRGGRSNNGIHAGTISISDREAHRARQTTNRRDLTTKKAFSSKTASKVTATEDPDNTEGGTSGKAREEGEGGERP
ncbi:hypothetical protein BC829DRAFT_458859 [Chytridium lagenaria]|nr:hypothetical protein BC829DRAFT_458859 [Chytridium lagenaria]